MEGKGGRKMEGEEGEEKYGERGKRRESIERECKSESEKGKKLYYFDK